MFKSNTPEMPGRRCCRVAQRWRPGTRTAGWITALLVVSMTGCSDSPVLATYAGDDRAVTFMQADYERLYHVHVPRRDELGPAAPLVLVLHGSGQTGEMLRSVTGLDEAADQAGFIVAYLEASMGNWDVFGDLASLGLDEIGYVRGVIDRVDQAYVMDRSRIIVVGFSNGGVFAQQVACKLSDRVAGIVAVSASLPRLLSEDCRPDHPVSALFMLGTDDSAFPLSGSSSVLSIDQTLAFWGGRNGCGGTRVRNPLPDIADDGTTVFLSRYRSCGNGVRTELDSIVGGGHSWPGAQPEPFGGIGHTSHDISANDEIVRFLRTIPPR